MEVSSLSILYVCLFICVFFTQFWKHSVRLYFYHWCGPWEPPGRERHTDQFGNPEQLKRVCKLIKHCLQPLMRRAEQWLVLNVILRRMCSNKYLCDCSSCQVEQKVTLMIVSGCRLHRQVCFLSHTHPALTCPAQGFNTPGTQSVTFAMNPEPVCSGMIN